MSELDEAITRLEQAVGAARCGGGPGEARRPKTSGWRMSPRRSAGGSTPRSPGWRSCSNGRTEMGQVVVKVNGRDFALSCADGQEPRIRRLAQYVDAKIGEFTKALGQVGEARLILLAALVIADELSDANEALPAGAQPHARRWRSRRWPCGRGDRSGRLRHPRHRRPHREHCGAHRDILGRERVELRGALGRLYPGADIYRLGAVPVGVVASIHGAHLQCRATVGLQRRRPRRLHSSGLAPSRRRPGPDRGA